MKRALASGIYSLLFLSSQIAAAAGPAGSGATGAGFFSKDRKDPTTSNAQRGRDSLTTEATTIIVKYNASAASASKAGGRAAANASSQSSAAVEMELADKLRGLKLGASVPRGIFSRESGTQPSTTHPATGSTGAVRAASAPNTSLRGLPTADRIARLLNRFPNRAHRTANSAANFDPPSLELNNYFTVVLPKGTKLQQSLSAIRSVKGVETAYPAVNYKTSISTPPPKAYRSAWGVSAIKAPAAWDTTTHGEGIVVGINDTGIHYKHAALAPNVWKNDGEIPGNCVDDDGNGYVDDQFGVDFTKSSSVHTMCPVTDSQGQDYNLAIHQPFDCNGHGSHVAGTIGATDSDGVGITGVAPGVKLLAAKGLSDYGEGTSESLAQGIVYLTDNGADVINNSWGSGPVSYADPLMTDAIRYAAAAGVINVFAAGNESFDMTLAHPAIMKEVITVGAIDDENQLARFSNFGARIDVVAPGVDVKSSFPDGCFNSEPDGPYPSVPVASHDYTELSGTSMAAPHVTGTVALLLSANPSLRVDEVRSILRATADDLLLTKGDLSTMGFDPYFGAGRVNAQKAVAYAKSKERVPVIDLNLSDNTPVRDAQGKLKPIRMSGTITGVNSFTLSVRSWKGGAVSRYLVAGNGDIRNKPFGQFDLTSLPDGKYVVELSGIAGRRVVNRTETLTISPRSTVLATTPGYASFISEPASFSGAYATWLPRSDLSSSTDDGKVLVVNRSRTNAVEFEYQTYPSTFEYHKLFKKGSFDLAGFFKDDKLSGYYSDVAVLGDMVGSYQTPVLLAPTVPSNYLLTAVNSSISQLNRYGFVWVQDREAFSLEDKIMGYRFAPNGMDPWGTPNGGKIETLVESGRMSYFWFPSIQYPIKETGSRPAAGKLITFEGKFDRNNNPISEKLVSYDLNARPISSGRKDLFTMESRERVWDVRTDSGFSCIVSYFYDSQGVQTARLTTVEINSGAAMKIAEQPMDKSTRLPPLWACQVPQDKFITYVRLYPRDGFKLVGYDLQTGKSGAISLPTGTNIYPDYYGDGSLVTTGDGNLSWKELNLAGSRLIEFDVTAFRAGINSGRVPRP